MMLAQETVTTGAAEAKPISFCAARLFDARQINDPCSLSVQTPLNREERRGTQRTQSKSLSQGAN
jgi:hypothetical protein